MDRLPTHSLPTNGHSKRILEAQHPPHQPIGQYALTRFLHRRSQYFTWSWFLSALASLGLSLVLANEPHRFYGLTTIGKVAYLFGVTQYVVILFFAVWRSLTQRGWFRQTLAEPSEALSFATSWMGFAALLGGARFGKQHLMVPNMTPSWLLPCFPVILCGTIASIAASGIEAVHAFPILIAGLTFQGLGFLMSILVFAIYLHRLFRVGLPDPEIRPAMFLAVGPPAFTSIALLRLTNDIPQYSYFLAHPDAKSILSVMSVFFAIFLWTYTFWVFCLALVACMMAFTRIPFHLSWYAFVFPNVGFTIAAIDIGRALESSAISWVATAMTLMVATVYVGVLLCHIRALWLGRSMV
ncbi:hypothetical protein DL98DRAFT_604919 [Cadophora sp. DSE1049]|nr:hypothetical protein DL98DRAFT_604919 [Cadophora sp. DSE1049]